MKLASRRSKTIDSRWALQGINKVRSMERELTAVSGKPASLAAGAVVVRPMSGSANEAGRTADAPEAKPSIFKKTWDGWMKFAEIMGTANLVIVLSIIYWTMVTIVAIPFRLATDPLRIKNSEGHAICG